MPADASIFFWKVRYVIPNYSGVVDKTKDLSSVRNSRKTNTYITKRGEEFYLFDKGKYERLRKGEIVPIPMSKTKGFVFWSGYEHTKNLRLKTLKASQYIKGCTIKHK